MAKLIKNPHKLFLKLAQKAEAEGKGFNEQIGMAAWAMRELNVPPQQAVEMIVDAAKTVTRRQPGKGEIERWVNKVYQTNATLRPYDQPKTGIKVEQRLIDEFSSKGSIRKIMDRSQPIPSDPSEILSQFYRPDALLHLSPSKFEPKDVMTCSEWLEQDLSAKQFICPAELKCKEMGRCLENVDFRNFLVYESDRPGLAGNWDAQAGCIERLSQDMPLKLIVYSGNKSLHAWYDISTRRKDQVQDFIGTCIKLGADQASMRPAQLVRMPWGIRREFQKKPKTQKVIFYDN